MTRLPHPGMEAPLLCELHAHTTWSDGALELPQVVDLYGRRGFDVLCITDHVVRGDDMLTAGRHPAYLAAIRDEGRRAVPPSSPPIPTAPCPTRSPPHDAPVLARP